MKWFSFKNPKQIQKWPRNTFRKVQVLDEYVSGRAPRDWCWSFGADTENSIIDISADFSVQQDKSLIIRTAFRCIGWKQHPLPIMSIPLILAHAHKWVETHMHVGNKKCSELATVLSWKPKKSCGCKQQRAIESHKVLHSYGGTCMCTPATCEGWRIQEKHARTHVDRHTR